MCHWLEQWHKTSHRRLNILPIFDENILFLLCPILYDYGSKIALKNQ